MRAAALTLFLWSSARSAGKFPAEPDRDPHAIRDPFLKLSDDELRKSWSRSEGDEGAAGAPHPHEHSRHVARTLSERLAEIDALDDLTYVDVRLVGFAGDGEHQLELSDSDVQRLLDAAAHAEHSQVLHPLPTAPHELPVRRRFLYRVSQGSPTLAKRVAAAVASHRPRGEASGDSFLVPLRAVDELVREDYRRGRSSHVTLYLLNPAAPRRPPSAAELAADPALTESSKGWDHRLRYAYEDAADEAAASAAEGRCPTTKWLGGRDRYIWVDLTAGPVAYGPATAGEGVVTEHSMPSVLSLASRFAGSEGEAELRSHLAVELAALAVATSHRLLAPPISYLPSRFYPKLTLLLVHVAPSADDYAHAAAGGAGTFDAPSIAAALDAQLSAAAAASGQELSVEPVSTSLDECGLCAAALTSATRAYAVDEPPNTQALPARAHPPSDFPARPPEPRPRPRPRRPPARDRAPSRLQVHAYLDSHALAASLRAFWSELPGLSSRTAASGERLLPVFLFSTVSPLLLDRRHLAMPFHDAVLAVATRNPMPHAPHAAASPPLLVLDDQCAGAPLHLNAWSITRPLLAAALQSGWGVAPPSTRWSAAHGRAETDLLWAVGPTPFGPYSRRANASFAAVDAAARAGLHAVGAELVGEVRSLGAHFDEFNLTVDQALTPAEQLPFLQRLNVLAYKLGRAASYLSMHNFGYARYYLHSTWHDLKAMRGLLHEAGAALSSHLVCE